MAPIEERSVQLSISIQVCAGAQHEHRGLAEVPAEIEPEPAVISRQENSCGDVRSDHAAAYEVQSELSAKAATRSICDRPTAHPRAVFIVDGGPNSRIRAETILQPPHVHDVCLDEEP